ncbi:cytidylate kinase [Novimethylophilus kurashikiensis]|uniref:Cytidylate kinase n=1 Tax=Novimethylophilus kurashikiensis TaxID=1825523 RepID=A0A2R5FFA5_9PROT|nr:cytidylate kinase [Novimethylophilus kurashikiensis]
MLKKIPKDDNDFSICHSLIEIRGGIKIRFEKNEIYINVLLFDDSAY